ncbi:unnamed protein product [Prorocentrum cordatum]|uniref:FH2 domain-containing protein n=1 Tax=Prorocentrum cordatum TaxID=2364126 RepID=A0ABN9PEN0_9DINO|nr:unnamed protein product [Polarella glacialis]
MRPARQHSWSSSAKHWTSSRKPPWPRWRSTCGPSAAWLPTLRASECWAFVRAYQDRVLAASQMLDDLAAVSEAFLRSAALLPLLGLVLAAGNILNEGTELGQAGGFELWSLGLLDAVRDDDEGDDVRHLLFEVFFRFFGEQAAQLCEELRPCLCNVARRRVEGPDGGAAVRKAVRVSLEDCEQHVASLEEELPATDHRNGY